MDNRQGDRVSGTLSKAEQLTGIGSAAYENKYGFHLTNLTGDDLEITATPKRNKDGEEITFTLENGWSATPPMLFRKVSIISGASSTIKLYATN